MRDESRVKSVEISRVSGVSELMVNGMPIDIRYENESLDIWIQLEY